MSLNVTENFADLFNSSLAQQQSKVGEIITTEVLRIDHNFVVVNAGLKSESYIPITEFHNDQGQLEVTVGEFVTVYIEDLENGFGETRLSRDKAKRLTTWIDLERRLETGETVMGLVTGKVKGGLNVVVNGLKSFLPGSLLDFKPIKDMTPFEGQTLELKVVKLDRKKNNVVLSRRAVIEVQLNEQRAKVMETMKEGDTVTGIIKNVTDYGAFVDLGGVDGLIHITDLSWKRVRHPSEILTPGEEVTAKILKFDYEKNRVSLGLKQLSQDPWSILAEQAQTGEPLTGKVSNITDYGCFVQIQDGIEGLVHISEMGWNTKNMSSRDLVQVGQEVQVVLVELNMETRRISLSMKKCQQNPWESFSQTYPKDSRVSGPVKTVAEFGVFVGLANNIDGLIHISDIAWENNEEVLRSIKKGDNIEAVVLGVDLDKGRVSLGLKQLTSDSFISYCEANPKGTIVTGTVESVEANRAIISLTDDVKAYLRASEIKEERVEDANTELKAGDSVTAIVTSYDRKDRFVNISIRQKDQSEQQVKIQKMNTESQDSGITGGNSLGNLLKEKLNNN